MHIINTLVVEFMGFLSFYIQDLDKLDGAEEVCENDVFVCRSFIQVGDVETF